MIYLLERRENPKANAGVAMSVNFHGHEVLIVARTRKNLQAVFSVIFPKDKRPVDFKKTGRVEVVADRFEKAKKLNQAKEKV